MGNRIFHKDSTTNDEEVVRLGSGAFGEIRLVTIPDEGRVASKALKGKTNNPWMESEATVQMAASHECIVKVFGLHKPRGMAEIAMEYMSGGNLHRLLLNKRKTLTFIQRHNMCYDVARGLEHLHNLPDGGCIIHNDIKPDNILLTQDLRCKIADFGCSKWYDEDGEFVDGCPKDLFCIAYAAPEKLHHHLFPFVDADNNVQQYHALIIEAVPASDLGLKDAYLPHESSDIYSFALLIYMLLYRRRPWSGSVGNFLAQVLRGERPETPKIYAKNSELKSAKTLLRLMLKCWKENIYKRPTSAEICLELQGLPSRL